MNTHSKRGPWVLPYMGLGSEALGWKNGFRAFHKAKTRSQDTQVNTVGCIFLSKTKSTRNCVY